MSTRTAFFKDQEHCCAKLVAKGLSKRTGNSDKTYFLNHKNKNKMAKEITLKPQQPPASFSPKSQPVFPL
jgi:hypothetical protein